MTNWFQTHANVEALDEHQLVDLDTTLNRDLTRVRYVTMISMLVIVIGMFWSMYNTVDSIDTNALAKAAEGEAAKVLPLLGDAAVDVGNQVAPSVATAFTIEAEKLAEDLESSLEKEVAQLQVSLPVKMEAALLKEMGKARAEQRQILVTKFPELKGKDKKIDQLFAAYESGTTKWAALVLSRVFERHLDELAKLRKTLNTFVNKKGAAGSDAAVDGEAVLSVWLEILDDTFSGQEETLQVRKKAPKK